MNREVYDYLGRRSVIQQRVYQERKGFILEPKFVFIDGRTGTTLHSETYRARSSTPPSRPCLRWRRTSS